MIYACVSVADKWEQGQAGPSVLSARPGSRTDVHFVSRLLKSLDWLPAAARGHVLGLSVFCFHLAPCLFFFMIALVHGLPDFMCFITPLVIVMTLSGVMF